MLCDEFQSLLACLYRLRSFQLFDPLRRQPPRSLDSTSSQTTSSAVNSAF
jgi:hypothetical protein